MPRLPTEGGRRCPRLPIALLLALGAATGPVAACGRVGYEPALLERAVDAGQDGAAGQGGAEVESGVEDTGESGEAGPGGSDGGTEAQGPPDGGPDAAAEDGVLQADGPDAGDAGPPPVDGPYNVITGQPLCPSPVFGADVLADFEDGTAAVKQVGGRAPVPFTIVLSGSGELNVVPRRTPPSCGSDQAMRLSATAIPPGRGHVQGRVRMDGEPFWEYFDGSAYRGVRMLLRGDRALRVTMRVGDRNTRYPQPYDHFSAILEVTTEWQSFTAPFNVLRQSGEGQAFPALDRGALYSVELQVAGAATFDLFVDDIVFLR